jgi:threonine/homoserine/homoserine lactone efflux protein
MIGPDILLFIATSLVIIMTPGQDLVLVLSRGVSQGSKAGIVTAAGVSTGLFGHTILTTVGIGALLMASDLIFSIVKYCGAAYLIYLGVKLLSTNGLPLDVQKSGSASLKRYFVSGALSNVSNPKITIFYFAYLPQFISTEVNEPAMQLFLLGITFALLTFLVKALIGFLAGKFSVWLKTRPNMLKWLDRTSGSILICLGLKLAFEQRN